MSSPAASSRVISHRGMPAAAAGAGPGAGRCPPSAGAGGGAGYRGRAGTVPAGEDRGAAGRVRVSTVPGRITSGSGPMTRRFAAYSAGQPPRTPSAAAIPARVSPGTTV